MPREEMTMALRRVARETEHVAPALPDGLLATSVLEPDAPRTREP